MRPLKHVGAHQILIIYGKHVHMAAALKSNPAPPRPGLQQQIDLRVMTQRLIMSVTRHRRCDRLLIKHLGRRKFHLHAKPVLNQAF